MIDITKDARSRRSCDVPSLKKSKVVDIIDIKGYIDAGGVLLGPYQAE